VLERFSLNLGLCVVKVISTPEGGAGGARIAYESIAPVYDEFTAHHDYAAWLGALVPILERHGLAGKRLLDVGCGTGKSFIPMLEQGWSVSACDISPAMVELARAKVGERAELAVADMRELPRCGEFDVVWALDDAVNYLADAADLERALARMRANLGPGGLLMFDANTIETYRSFFAEHVEVEQPEQDRRLIWDGRSSPEAEYGALNEAAFEVRSLDRSEELIEPQMHRQRHFPEAVVLTALERAGLECIDVYGHHHDGIPKQPLDEIAHAKAIYFARDAA
jgi:SAM-dependent methyltransferase